MTLGDLCSNLTARFSVSFIRSRDTVPHGESARPSPGGRSSNTTAVKGPRAAHGSACMGLSPGPFPTVSVCCFRPPCLWSFVTTAPGDHPGGKASRRRWQDEQNQAERIVEVGEDRPSSITPGSRRPRGPGPGRQSGRAASP